jgi:hypothetical protein
MEFQTQTELSSYLYAASFASLNDEIKNIFGYMKRRFCESSFVLLNLLNVHQQVRPKLALPVTPALVRIIHLENSVRAKCHHCHQIVIQPLHLSGQIAALFTRDGSGEPFHVL